MNDLSKISVVLPSLDPDEKLVAVIDGLLEYGIINEGMVIGVMSYAANPEAAYAFVDWLVETMQTERPDSLDEQTPQDTQNSADTVSDMPSY